MSTVHRLPVLYIYACVYAILLSTVLHRLGIQLLKTARGAQKCSGRQLLLCYHVMGIIRNVVLEEIGLSLIWRY